MNGLTRKPSLLELFQKLHAVEQELWDHHKIRQEGAYAERLVALALGAAVNTNGVYRGSDLVHPTLMRIEVRSRRLPLDARNETRISLTLKRGLFEHCAHVLFDSDYSVKGGYIVPHDAIFEHLNATGKRYVRFEQGAALSQARDITESLIAAQREM
jgi:hypothetical protein